MICQRLDGLPLAVELAAARVRALGAEGLLASLSERLDGLAGGRRAPPRHQTLRAAVEWSLDLLSSRQRLGFALLSVFAGGFDLRAAETVLLVEGFDRDEAADLMVELVDRSMVEPDAIGHTPPIPAVGDVAPLRNRAARQARRRRRPPRPRRALRRLGGGPRGRSPRAPSRASPWSSTSWRWPTCAPPSSGVSPPTTSSSPAGSPKRGLEFGEYSLDFEAVAWAEAACEPARARRLPVAVTLIAIVRLRERTCAVT